MSLIFLVLRLSLIWPVRAPSNGLQCLVTCIGKSRFIFQYNKILQAYLVLTLPQPWNQPFLWGSLVLLRDNIWTLGVLIAPAKYFTEFNKVILKFMWNCKGHEIAKYRKRRTKLEDLYYLTSRLTICSNIYNNREGMGMAKR